MRSFSGCWTCRVRRKKCDETHPVCDVCAALNITCHYGYDKPAWMDGGRRQKEMVMQLRREVRAQARRRRGESVSGSETPGASMVALDEETSNHQITPGLDSSTVISNDARTDNFGTIAESGTQPSSQNRLNVDGILDEIGSCKPGPSGWPDACIFTFYFENVLPFIFPFYRPSLKDGGRSWILDMMMCSPLVRQTALCQSSYFFSLALGVANCSVAWEKVLKQTEDAYKMLNRTLQAFKERGIAEHLHETVRILASIMQMQSFDIAMANFGNCQIHLNAAVTLLKEILDSPGPVRETGVRLNFNLVMNRLGPSSWVLPSTCMQVASAEQAAFPFSSALLIVNDIITSTAFQEQPRLYEYHHDLLQADNGADPLINLEAIIGCQNWVMLRMGEIAALDAWKQKCKATESLDVMELVHRARIIKDSLESQLARFETETSLPSENATNAKNIFNAYHTQPTESLIRQKFLVTRVWAHAAQLYLYVVVSGWQAASPDVQYIVGRIMDLLTRQISSPELLRTMVWPFCIAGCFAEPAQQPILRNMVQMLQPQSAFGTVHKALEIMENVWCDRNVGDVSRRDFAVCFRSQGELTILV